MIRRLAGTALVLMAVTASAQETQSPKPPVVIQTAKAGTVQVHYWPMPWGPQTFAAMEGGGSGFYNTRTWPFARLETTAPVTLDGTKIPAGNYALVFHPNNVEKQGMSLEVLKINVREFLEAGNVMAKTPEGVSLHKAPITFEAAKDTTPALKIDLAQGKGSVTMTIQYGDRKLVKELKL